MCVCERERKKEERKGNSSVIQSSVCLWHQFVSSWLVTFFWLEQFLLVAFFVLLLMHLRFDLKLIYIKSALSQSLVWGWFIVAVWNKCKNAKSQQWWSCSQFRDFFFGVVLEEIVYYKDVGALPEPSFMIVLAFFFLWKCLPIFLTKKIK